MQVRKKIGSIKKFYLENIHKITCAFQKNTLHLTGAACMGSFLIGSGKLAIAFLSMSFITFISALYTFAIVCAKAYILYGIAHSRNNIVKQFRYYKRSGSFLIMAGIAYMLYAIQLLRYPTTSNFDQNTAISIALFTFVELGLNIKGILVERKNAMPLFHALKIVNLASSCICLVLTQTALLAYTSTQSAIPHNMNSNGLIGILMGFISTLLGIYSIHRANRMMSGKDEKGIKRKIEHLLKKQQMDIPFDIRNIYMRNDGFRIIEVNFKNQMDEQAKKEVYLAALQKLNIVIFDKHDTIREKEMA